MFEVLRPGLLSTVQDKGRVGYRHLGVSQCGAMDLPSMQLANTLIGNVENAAVVEVAQGGLVIRFLNATHIALCGAEMEADVDGQVLWSGWSRKVDSGQVLTLKGVRKTQANRANFAYLAFSGGIVVPQVLGSSSTDLNAGFGGFHGRALKGGDYVSFFGDSKLNSKLADSSGLRQVHWDGVIRALDGPAATLFSESAIHDFWNSEWEVGVKSNRMATELTGHILHTTADVSMASRAVMPGVVQVPPSGAPIVLQSDAQTTGGYPEIAVVIEADRWKLAQASVRQFIQFKRVSIDETVKVNEQWQTYFNRIKTHAKN